MTQLKIMTVADPMMGLLWETWPTHRKLETHFNYQIDFTTLMGQLVPDVYALVDQATLSQYGKKVALNQYWVKLMQIYLQEASLAGMPIQMGQGERFFDADHTSSTPLSKGLRVISKQNSRLEDQVLYELQYDTVIRNRQTNDVNYLKRLAKKFGFSETQFMTTYQSSELAANLDEEQQVVSRLKINQLPAYVVTYNEQSYVIKGVLKYKEWLDIIQQITNGVVKPIKVNFNSTAVAELMARHPHISSLEIKEAFDVADEAVVIKKMSTCNLSKTKVKQTIFYQ
ncbi:DsbA family protein [Lactiplantibacillus plantarum]|uniref:DsbA family protein n=1 Tax=Lactiplantibacillus plantarum TaxID=1590 RepID=UPI00217D848D|nr:DsbA family protein [Lactiplantibacillus plantarum]MCS6157151.1 DsbA family protein [Lactiplantibacillus plantarum]